MSAIVLVAALLVSFAVVSMLLGVRGLVMSRRALFRARFDRAVHTADASGDVPSVASSPSRRALGVLSRLARPSAGKDLVKLRLGLTRAGLRGEGALEVYLGVKIALALGLAALVLPLRALVGGSDVLSGFRPEMLAVVLAAIGFYAPNLWVRLRRRARQLALIRGLPDALDLLVTSVEAGLSLEAALVRITAEIGRSSPVLAAELQQTTLEMQAGIPRPEAFRRLAERTGLEELRSLAATLMQTEMFGTSIARSLRMHAGTMRMHRTHRAEERAATVSVRLLLPLILCILPSLIAVLMAPAIVRVMRLLTFDGGGAP